MYEGMNLTSSLHFFILQHVVLSLHLTGTVISHRGFAPHYRVEEIFFNISNKLTTPGVS